MSILGFAKGSSVVLGGLFCAMVAAILLGEARADRETARQATIPSAESLTLGGVWTLVRCDNVYPDGRRVELYGPNPQGRWIVDASGDYMMQIVRAERVRFAANDKSKGTPEEYRAATLDFNAHFGHVDVEANTMTLHIRIDHASFPNWDGRDSHAPFTRHGDELTYTVSAPSSGAAEGAKGEVVWRRQSP